MRPRRLGALICSIGLCLLLTPVYWDWLTEIGVAAALDPAATLGVGTGGGYPVAVGAVAMAVGAAGVVYSALDTQPTELFLTACLFGAGLGILAVTVLARIPTVLAIRVALAGAAPGFASVRGAATDRSRRRLGGVGLCLSLLAFVGEYVVIGVTTSGWSMYINLVLAVTLVGYTAVLSYPFYRLGRATR